MRQIPTGSPKEFIMIKVPVDLKQRFKEAAIADNRSMTALLQNLMQKHLESLSDAPTALSR